MTKLEPTNEQYNIYVDFVHLLNQRGGQLSTDSATYYDFLDGHLISHRQAMRIVHLATSCYKHPVYIVHRNRAATGVEDGIFYLTSNGSNIVSGLSPHALPQKVCIPEEKTAEITLDILDKLVDEVKEEKKKEAPKKTEKWTKEQIVKLMTKEAHIVGRMLGTGYDLLEPIHGEWIYTWLINPNDFKVIIHQAHRNSYKSSCLRLAIAELMILVPDLTIILIRKSEDAVKELVSGVSKILDTPLFQEFVSVLHPDIKNKGGFKKTTDTALIIDTNLNTSLSGEPQLRGVGLGSPLTGKHAKMIITDDIVTLDDRESEAERRNTISKYQELINIISEGKGFEGSIILNIGTPWHEEDAFQTMEKGLIDKQQRLIELEEIPTKERTERQNKAIKCYNRQRGLFSYSCYETGLMTTEQIERKRKALNDDVLFAANYELSLVSDDEKPFPRINNVGNYTTGYFSNAWEVIATIDGAYGGDDRCSLSIGTMDWDNYAVVVLGKMYKDALDKNYIELAELMHSMGVSTLYMETNADKGLMGEKFRELGFNVVSYHESQNKHTKIVSTIRPFWRERGEELMPSVQFVQGTDSEYLSQIHNYKKGVRHDDAPDNLACLLLRGKFGAMAIRVT